MESVAARADACYYSSFTCAYFRLPDIDPEWHDGELYDSVAGGRHGPTAAYAAAALRLRATPGMAALMEKLTVHDRPRRAQGKIMNLTDEKGGERTRLAVWSLKSLIPDFASLRPKVKAL